jgi:lipoprotein signal peptidase
VRSPAIYGGAAVVALALLALAPRVGSRAVSAGAGLAAGGALATSIAGVAWWHDGVPNPFVARELAFNLADLAIGAGVLLLIGGALVHAARNRDRLLDRV